MDIEDIYERMRELGLAKSQMQFSAIWLGRSPRYYSHLMAIGRQPGLATLIGLEWRLEQLLECLSGTRRTAILDLKQTLARHCDRRAITDITRPRSGQQ